MMNIIAAKYSLDIRDVYYITKDSVKLIYYTVNYIVKHTSYVVTSKFFYITFWIIAGVAILLMLAAVLPENKPKNKPENTTSSFLGVASGILFSPLTFKTAKFIWKRRNKIPVEKQQQILNVAKNISEPETRQLINQTTTNLAQQYLQKNNDANNANGKDGQPKLQTETHKQIDELSIETAATDNEQIEISNEAQEKGKTRKIIVRAAKELAKNYLQQESKNTQDSVNISGSKTRKAITQTAKAIAKAYLEETSETKELNSETEAKPGRRFRFVGKAARSLGKRYLNQQ